MKYLIYENNSLKEVSEVEYENWFENKVDEYLLPVYSVEIDNLKYIVDTDYQGVFEDGSECCPFVLFYFEKVSGEENVNEQTEYFDTFEELKERRQKLIQAIENKITTQ